MDQVLAAGMDAGRSYAQIARALGVSRNAAIGRSYRLRGFDQRDRTAKHAAWTRAAELRRQAIAAVITLMHEELAGGMPRKLAFGRAWARGATLTAIGDSVELTKERIRQIIKA